MNREKFLQQVIGVLLVMVFLVGCESTSLTPVAEAPTVASARELETATPPTELPSPTATTEPSARILFVGNSLTFHNSGVYNHLELLAGSADPPQIIQADEATVPGATLQKLWGSQARELIGKGIYDVVVLQEDLPETDPATGVDTFFKYVRQFDAEIKKVGARPVLFMTWSYERLGWITMDQIAQAHREVATELGIDVAPVGLAFQRAMKERPDLDMYDLDGEHPSIYGTYLATNVIYATVFGKSPIGLPYMPREGIYRLSNGRATRGIAEEDAAFLQRIAWETVQGYQAQQ